MSERKHVVCWYFPWNDDKEERWLERMAASGWHLVTVGFIYVFECGAPAQIRYQIDYPPQQPDLDEYLRLCRDAGWEWVGSYFGSQYFRTTSPEVPEIYTDKASRVAKYRRLFAISLLLAITTVAANMSSLLDTSSGSHAHLMIIGTVRWVVIVIICLWVYILTRLAMHIRRLKRKACP